MKTLIVYDSKFGTTERIAQAIAKVLEEAGPVRLVATTDTHQLDLAGIDLLVVGGPTQGHGISQPLRALLATMPADAARGLPAAAFDTRFGQPRFITGSAAVGIARQLKRNGARLVVPAERFIVTGTKGPLKDGELARAGIWATGVRAGAQEQERVPATS